MSNEREQLANLLRQTLSVVAAERKAGEQQLQQLEAIPGVGVHLLGVSTAETCPPEIRMAAAVAAKNFVKRNWQDDSGRDVGDDERASLRRSALEAMFSTGGNIRAQIAHIVHLVAKVDFPARWPELIVTLAQQLLSDNHDNRLAAMQATDLLVEKFRFETKSDQLWRELKMILDTVADPITRQWNALVSMLGSGLDKTQHPLWAESAFLLTRIYHSLCSQDLPEFFEDHLSEWQPPMTRMLSLQLDGIQSSGGEPTTLEKLKTEICEIVTLFAQRYEEEFFKYMEGAIEAIWGLVSSTPADSRFDGVVGAAIGYLAAICQRQQYEQMFVQENVLKMLGQDVAVRNMSLRESDLEQFEDEPVEFLRCDLEGSDAASRRRGAVNFVRALCKRFEDKLVPVLLDSMCTFLQSGEWQKRDVVYCLMTAIAAKGETAKSGVTTVSQFVNVGDFFVNCVVGDLGNANIDGMPILKADAFKFVATFRSQLSKQQLLVTIASAADQLERGNLPILHKYAAYAFDKVLSLRDPVSKARVFAPSEFPLERLASGVLRAFSLDPKAQNSAYLARALLTLVEMLEANTSSSLTVFTEITGRVLGLVVAATKCPADPVHIHFLFETLAVLIQKTGSTSSGVDGQILGLVKEVLANDLQDLIPYVIQIMALLVDAWRARSDTSLSMEALSLAPQLFSDALWQRTSNLPAVIQLVGALVRAFPDALMANYAGDLLRHYSRLISVRSLDHYGFQLAAALLPILQSSNEFATAVLNAQFGRIQKLRTPKLMRSWLLFVAKTLLAWGPVHFVRVLDSLQAGMAKMVFERLVLVELANFAQVASVDDKRTVCLALAALLRQRSQVLPELYDQLVSGAVALAESVRDSQATADTSANSTSAAGTAEESEAAAFFNADGSFSNPFARLVHAHQKEQPLPEVVDWKRYLAESLSAAGQTNP